MATYGDLTRQSVSAVKWSAMGTLARYGLQFGAQIVLARLLGPENYGLFAMGMLVLNMSSFFADFGLAWGLVQNQNINNDTIRFTFTWQMITGSVIAVALYLLAPQISHYFREPRIVSIVRWLSLACILNAAAAPATNLLRRNLDFRWINIVQICSYSIGYLVFGIPLAFCGAGVWALVIAWLIQSACTLVLTFVRSRHSIKPLLWYQGAASVTSVGMTVFVTNISNWFLNNLDRTLLGRYQNAHTVGLYSLGYNLANLPNALFVSVLQPAFLSAGTRLQSEPARLREAYRSVLGCTWIVITPMFVLLGVLAPDIVAILYGPAWALSGRVFALLAFAMPAYIACAMSTPVLWNTGKKQYESLLQLPVLVIAFVAFLKGMGQGVLIIAAIASSIIYMRAIIITVAACRQLRIGLHDLCGDACRCAIMVSITGMGAFVGTKAGHLVGGPAIYSVAAGVLIDIVMLGTALLTLPGLMSPRVMNMLERFGQQLPAAFVNFMPKFDKKVR